MRDLRNCVLVYPTVRFKRVQPKKRKFEEATICLLLYTESVSQNSNGFRTIIRSRERSVMSLDFVKPTKTRSASPAVTALAWMIAIGAPGCFLYCNGVQSARREAEESVIAQVAGTISSTSRDRDEVLALLVKRQREVSDIRYVRTCNRLGIPMNWDMLFAQLRRRNKAEQAKAALVIAEECGMSRDWSLKREQMLLNAGSLSPMPLLKMMPIRVPVAPTLD